MSSAAVVIGGITFKSFFFFLAISTKGNNFCSFSEWHSSSKIGSSLKGKNLLLEREIKRKPEHAPVIYRIAQ